MARNVYTPRRVRKQGKRDGRDWWWKPWRPFPGWPLWETKDSTPSPSSQRSSQYEEAMQSDAIANLNRIADAWSQRDDKLLNEYCAAKKDLDHLKDKHDKEFGEYEATVKPLETARTEYERFASRWMPYWVYWTIFAVITIGEGFFNYFVFQMFGEREWQTALMAVAIILVIPLSSELLGHFLKKDIKTSMDKFFIIAAIAVVCGLLFGLAILREAFFEINIISEDQKFPLSPVKLAAILIIFNLAIFVILTFLSYAEARKDPESYRQARDKYRGTLKISEMEGFDLKKIDPIIRKAVERYAVAQAKRISCFKEFQSKAERERNSWIAYIRIYRHANETARREYKEITSFNKSPEDTLLLPEKLRVLHWECKKDDITI